MLTLIVGHRGVGKTQFLKRYKKYFPWVETYDLDQVVEKVFQKSVRDIFRDEGEETFRRREESVLLRLAETVLDTDQVVVALGAGYRGEIPVGARVLWLRRDSDQRGRIFLDRPALHPQLRPLEEWDHIFRERNDRYASISDRIWTCPEGLIDADDPLEKAFLENEIDCRGAWITLMPSRFKSSQSFFRWLEDHKKWNLEKFELRLDLLDASMVSQAMRGLSRSQLLMSFRPTMTFSITPLNGVAFDWDLLLGKVPSGSEPKIVSLHERTQGQDLSECFQRLAEFKKTQNMSDKVIEKLSVEISSFAELGRAQKWVDESPLTRAFFPRSSRGSYQWFRLQVPQVFEFIREDEGPSLDQPIIYDCLKHRREFNQFAAVLGSPVSHSFSPYEHQDFAQSRGLNFLKIPMSRDEAANPDAFIVLKRLGLIEAAVTSPLKKWAFKQATFSSHDAQAFQSANTLLIGESVKAALTDYSALKSFLNDRLGSFKNIVVAGTGAMAELIQDICPRAHFVSARTEGLKSLLCDLQPEVLVWAGGSARDFNISDFSELHLIKVIDLNYSEDSAGREIAHHLECEYSSGLDFFYAQAEQQRIIWRSENVSV